MTLPTVTVVLGSIVSLMLKDALLVSAVIEIVTPSLNASAFPFGGAFWFAPRLSVVLASGL